VGITSTEPGGLARPRKTICKLKRFVNDLERSTDILCQWYALIAALSRIALAAAIVRIILIGGDVPNRAGTVATVRIEITDVQTTNALTASSKGTPKDFARMCSVRIAIFFVT
jgi:hypothetical protein